jgi:hypothetical protein
MLKRLIASIFCLLILTLGVEAEASPTVFFGVDNLGGGIFQYNLIINNSGGSEPLSGLLVLHGGSVFGLDATSAIGAPQDVGGNPAADWSFIAPFFPFVDILSYFSLNPAADVPINGVLMGFFFQSMENPENVNDNDFAVVGIGANSAGEIPLGNAQFVREPSSLTLLCFGLAGTAIVSFVRQSWRRATSTGVASLRFARGARRFRREQSLRRRPP